MNKPTSNQRELLAQAAASEPGDIEATPDIKSTGASPIKRGLMISVPQANGPSRLLITEAGRAAIGAEPVAPNKPTRKRAEKTAPAPKAEKKGKVPTLVELLSRPQGATIPAMMEATGWQAHSVRGAMSGPIGKKLGLTVTSEKTVAGRVYRIGAQVPA